VTLGKYILKDGKPVLEPNLMKWAMWIEHSPERVMARWQKGGVVVTTIFIGVDHNFSGKGEPTLWETMVRGGRLHGFMCRYNSARLAKRGHQRIVKMVEAEMPDEIVTTE
jgi:hypothetical protein